MLQHEINTVVTLHENDTRQVLNSSFVNNPFQRERERERAGGPINHYFVHVMPRDSWPGAQAPGPRHDGYISAAPARQPLVY
jgi:hypothetical protein